MAAMLQRITARELVFVIFDGIISSKLRANEFMPIMNHAWFRQYPGPEYTFNQFSSMKSAPWGQISKPSLAQIMAAHRTGDKLLSELMRASFSNEYMRHSTLMS